MTVKGGTSQACAACKYQRRKCSADCQLARYFPPDNPRMFQNAHKLFGVSNILRILKNLKGPKEEEEAMRTIIYESKVRDRYPVHGCYGIIVELHCKINQAELELEAVNAQLNFYRQEQQHQMSQSSPPPNHSPPHLQLGNTSPINALPLFQQHPHQSYNDMASGINQQHNSLSNGSNGVVYNRNPEYVESKEGIVNSFWVPCNNSLATQPQFIATQAFPIQQVPEAPQDYDEMPVFFDTADDRQSYNESKDAYESSPESSLKDTKQPIEQVAENELKSAAACFTLTSVN
ncbi:hypothetical protein Scep_021684 [Stephania cephalantha]|uniref:LOB domain-containing protein n=1 Tax=Stephania cephalantha TaxID=152367 RepID=A0AAP0F6G7_9MAGN